jgi:hypothetical protein
MANWPIPAHGVISLSNSSRFPLMPYSNVVNRVVLPPGRARLATSPSPTGSSRARPGSLTRKCRRYGSRSPCRRCYRHLPRADSAALPHFDDLAATAHNLRPIDTISSWRNPALERADCPICGAQPLHHHVECESEQRLAERWILQSSSSS